MCLAGRAVLLNSLRELYNTDHMSDMTLVVGGRRIPAHRHVLATHSIVFDRMLSTSMREVRLSVANSLTGVCMLASFSHVLRSHDDDTFHGLPQLLGG